MSVQDEEQLDPKALHDILRGYVKTALLRAAVQLRVFDELESGPLEAREVAHRLGTDTRGMRI
ncbi:methyltransferase, partial [Streptomyces sp. SID11233]|nr:methyltransferase [Streptomyces sp. SID11233]